MPRTATNGLKYFGALSGLAAVVVAGFFVTSLSAQKSAGARVDPSPIYGVSIPADYLDWKLISVDHLVAGSANQLRAQLGNDIAIRALREGKLPFPDGAIIAALHWNYVPSESNPVLAKAGAQAFVPGPVVNIQFMVKDSKKYAATGGWGFADFKDGKPSDEATHRTCFACHQPAQAHDFIYAQYAPTF